MPPKATSSKTVVAARTSGGAIRSQGAFRTRGGTGAFRRPITFAPNRFNSYWGGRRVYDNFVYYPAPFPVYSYASVPYPIAPIITNYTVANPLTYFGTCQARDGVGVTNNSCGPGLVAIPQAGNTCTCYDRTSGSSGCSNVAGATCAPITPYPFL